MSVSVKLCGLYLPLNPVQGLLKWVSGSWRRMAKTLHPVCKICPALTNQLTNVCRLPVIFHHFRVIFCCSQFVLYKILSVDHPILCKNHLGGEIPLFGGFVWLDEEDMGLGSCAIILHYTLVEEVRELIVFIQSKLHINFFKCCKLGGNYFRGKYTLM